MRPKKVILYVDANEQNVSIMKFALNTNGYRVLGATDFAEALQLFIENTVNLVAVFEQPSMDSDGLILEMKKLRAHIPVVLFADPLQVPDNHADALLPPRVVPMIEILERFKVMMARKRGPRAGTYRGHPSKGAASEILNQAHAEALAEIENQ